MPAGGGGAEPEALAARAVLRLDDLPGEGWRAEPDEGADAAGHADDPSLDAALAGLPEHEVVASATSPRFTRGDAIAWSVSWVLATPVAAEAAAAHLAGHGFASSFVDSVAASLEPGGAGAPDDGPVVLGAVTDPAAPVPGGAAGTRHRARVTAGTGAGALVVHLDLVVLHAGTTSALLVVGDSPEPPDDPWVAAVATRLAGRLPR